MGRWLLAALLGLIAAGRAEAGFIVGSTVTVSIVGINPNFLGTATLADPGQELSTPVNAPFHGAGVRAIADLTATTVRVGVVSDATGFSSAFLGTAISFNLTGLSVLVNGSNFRRNGGVGAYSCSTTANSSSVQFLGFDLGFESPLERSGRHDHLRGRDELDGPGALLAGPLLRPVTGRRGVRPGPDLGGLICRSVLDQVLPRDHREHRRKAGERTGAGDLNLERPMVHDPPGQDDHRDVFAFGAEIASGRVRRV